MESRGTKLGKELRDFFKAFLVLVEPNDPKKTLVSTIVVHPPVKKD